LILGVIGIYGLVAYLVQQRTPEIGVRMALGGDAYSVRNTIVRHGRVGGPPSKSDAAVSKV
jgi:ABC-type antimicrobial peptide transport system permease subunit